MYMDYATLRQRGTPDTYCFRANMTFVIIQLSLSTEAKFTHDFLGSA